MREPPILTTELTLQLERHIAPSDTFAPEPNCEVVRFGKTIACKQHGGWPPSAVNCFNGDDVGRLDEILGFFGDINPLFYLVHGGFKAEVGQALDAAGFWMCDWKQTILYGLPLAEPGLLPAGITIEWVTPDTIDAAAEVAALGNEWPQDWRESAKNGVRRSIHQQNHQLFLARLDGEPAGVGGLSKSGAFNTWCGLGGGAVVPRFRGKGVHTALLRHRLHAAFKSNYDFVVSGANFGSASFRNQQRAGLRLGYLETIWKKRK